ncbi:unnamed protein product [Soboliphyme baturini]|uniref:Secreted protein n=1 Tax=Soboliphyme baturini TaxID=241478 RepID=A0A183IQX6_9BILA|nr:unnamed protein product [Soboliphyme baturini]
MFYCALWHFRVGQALCLNGKNPNANFGTKVLNAGISNLSLTCRTDLANKLLQIRNRFQHSWLSRNMSSTLPNVLKIFDNMFRLLLPPKLSVLGESLL